MAKIEVKSAYWDKEYIIKEVQAGENRIRFSLCDKRGRTWLSIREWYQTPSKEYAPGKHGMAVPLDDPGILTDMMAALEDTWAEMKEEA